MDCTPSPLEQSIANRARLVLDGVRSGDDVPFPDYMSLEPRDLPFYGLMSGLEYFVREVIGEVEHCAYLDGLMPYRVRKLAPLEADIIGACWYIEEQTLAPFHVQFRVSPQVDVLDWCYCCLGELRPYGEITWPGSVGATTVGLKIASRLDQVRWKHCVEYGERKPAAS